VAMFTGRSGDNVLRGLYVRDLLRELVGREMKVRYRRSFLGILWSLLNPLVHLIVLVFVFQRVTPLNIPDYPLFVFIGVLAWGWFSGALPAATTSITGNRELIRQPGFPTAILPAVPILSGLVHFLIAMSLVLVAIVLGGRPVSIAVLALPLIVALQFLVTLSVGYLAATAQVRFQDTTYLVGVALLLGFFLTPVFYRPGSLSARYQTLYVVNPMAQVITAYRDVLIGAHWPDFPVLVAVTAVSSIVLALGRRMFTRASVDFVEET
jgi:lipopolysaccharide transport system permease protein